MAKEGAMKSTEKGKVLLVDDEDNICQIMMNYLQSEGYETMVAHNAAEALKTVNEKKLDLLVVDVVLPDVDGYTLARQLRDNEKTFLTPVIMISAKKKDYKDKLSGFLSGACDYLTKPFTKEDFIKSVDKVLSI